MTVEMAVLTRLGQVAAVTAVVSTRIYYLKLPQTPRLPAIRVQLISDPKGHHLRGPDGTTGARVQVDLFVSESVADPYGSLSALGAAVSDALDGATFVVSDVRVTGAFQIDRAIEYEPPELRLLRERQDYTVWSKAA